MVALRRARRPDRHPAGRVWAANVSLVIDSSGIFEFEKVVAGACTSIVITRRAGRIRVRLALAMLVLRVALRMEPLRGPR